MTLHYPRLTFDCPDLDDCEKVGHSLDPWADTCECCGKDLST